MRRVNEPMPLKVLLKKGDSGVWLAISLERYIVAQGRTKDEVLEQFALSLAAEIVLGVKMGNSVEHPLAGIVPAPSKYWDMYEQATSEEKNPKIKIPDLAELLPRLPTIPTFAPLRLAEAYQ